MKWQLNRDWVTTPVAAQRTGYARVTIWWLAFTGRVKAQQFGPTWLVSLRSVRAWQRRKQERGHEPSPQTRAIIRKVHEELARSGQPLPPAMAELAKRHNGA